MWRGQWISRSRCVCVDVVWWVRCVTFDDGIWVGLLVGRVFCLVVCGESTWGCRWMCARVIDVSSPFCSGVGIVSWVCVCGPVVWLCCVSDWLVVGYCGVSWRWMLGFGVNMWAGAVISLWQHSLRWFYLSLACYYSHCVCCRVGCMYVGYVYGWDFIV